MEKINQQNNTSDKSCLHYLIDPSFQGISRLFVLLFENVTDKTVHTKYYLPTVEVKSWNVIFDGQNSFDQLEKNDLKISKTCDWFCELRLQFQKLLLDDSSRLK